jgi:hypothetical protein
LNVDAAIWLRPFLDVAGDQVDSFGVPRFNFVIAAGVRWSTPRKTGAVKEEVMKESIQVLNLEVEEIESRERGGGCETSSSTSRLCTCACRYTTTLAAQAQR